MCKACMALSSSVVKLAKKSRLMRYTTLQRTFDQPDANGKLTKYWRVTGPSTHRNFGSDLSLEGLHYWNIV